LYKEQKPVEICSTSVPHLDKQKQTKFAEAVWNANGQYYPAYNCSCVHVQVFSIHSMTVHIFDAALLIEYSSDSPYIQLEYKWDIVNNLDGFFIRMPVEKLGYFYGMQHVNTKWDIVNIQTN